MFSWHSLLVLAEVLAQRGDEASTRDAISRAYYCAFHLARRLLVIDGIAAPDQRSVHVFVWMTLRAQGKARRRIGIDGMRLRSLRCEADYDDTVHDLAGKVVDALDLARGLVVLLDGELRRARSRMS